MGKAYFGMIIKCKDVEEGSVTHTPFVLKLSAHRPGMDPVIVELPVPALSTQQGIAEAAAQALQAAGVNVKRDPGGDTIIVKDVTKIDGAPKTSGNFSLHMWPAPVPEGEQEVEIEWE